jgi:pimeloyl-ACP methyl ester carboxylesterase
MAPLIILHGWGSNIDKWQNLKDILNEAGIAVLLPKLPGHQGTKMKKPFNLNDFEKWFLNYCNDQKIDRFNLLGHSFGGLIAAKFAATYPEKVEKLILYAPAVAGNFSPKRILFFTIAQTCRFIFSVPLLKKFYNNVKENLKAKGVKEYYFAKGSERKTLSLASKERTANLLNKIKSKTLIIWGNEDSHISVKYALKVKKQIGDCELMTLSGGHSLHQQIPETLAKKIIKFLK